LLATTPKGSSTGTWSGTSSTKSTKSTKTGAKAAVTYGGGKGQNGRGSEYSASGLIRGDWPEDYPAPVLRRDSTSKSIPKGKVALELANGEVKYEDFTKRLVVYPNGVWVNETSITFPVESSSDYALFEELVDEAANGASPSTLWDDEGDGVWDV
jgi:hypothetical protein